MTDFAATDSSSMQDGSGMLSNTRAKSVKQNDDFGMAARMRNLSYADSMQQRSALFEKRLGAYLEDPGVGQIHDLRTSIRRIESTYDALPRSAKTYHSRAFFERAKLLFKKTGRMRDADVIGQVLTDLGVPRDSDSIKNLLRGKLAELEAARKDAMEIALMGAPVTNTVAIHKIAARRKKAMWVLFDEIRPMSKDVASDESNVKLLHFMRKKVKRLRYLLEDEIGYCNAVAADMHTKVDSVVGLAGEKIGGAGYDNGDTRQSYGDALLGMLASVIQVQKSAGSIRDCDIAIWYITEHYSSLKKDGCLPADLFDALHVRRHALYVDLVGF